MICPGCDTGVFVGSDSDTPGAVLFEIRSGPGLVQHTKERCGPRQTTEDRVAGAERDWRREADRRAHDLLTAAGVELGGLTVDERVEMLLARLEAIRRAVLPMVEAGEKASQAPWTYDGQNYIFGCESAMIAEMRGFGGAQPIDDNAAFITTARAAVPHIRTAVSGWAPFVLESVLAKAAKIVAAGAHHTWCKGLSRGQECDCGFQAIVDALDPSKAHLRVVVDPGTDELGSADVRTNIVRWLNAEAQRVVPETAQALTFAQARHEDERWFEAIVAAEKEKAMPPECPDCGRNHALDAKCSAGEMVAISRRDRMLLRTAAQERLATLDAMTLTDTFSAQHLNAECADLRAALRRAGASFP